MANCKTKKSGKDSSPSKKKSDAKHGLTPTQLHNARKRRAKQKKQQSSSSSPADPSAQYLSNPHAAPLVQTAKRFFAEKDTKFRVYQNGSKNGWRTVSKLPVRRVSDTNQIAVGMFQPKSHKVVFQQEEYPAHHPSINAGTTALSMACQEMGIDVYDEHQGTGYLRFVALNVERATGKLQMTLVWKDAPYEEDFNLDLQPKKKRKKKRKPTDARAMGKAQLERLLSHLWKLGYQKTEEGEDSPSKKKKKDKHPPFQLHSLWVHYNDAWKHSNAIFDIHTPNTWQHIQGPKTIAEHMLGCSNAPTLHFGPNVFRQANLEAFGHIIQAIQKRIQKLPKRAPIRCLELYGGVGTIGFHLLDQVDHWICSDENPHNQACFGASRDLLSPQAQKKCQYVPQNASDMVQGGHLKGQQVVIVDPPRKGLDDTVLDHLVDTDKSSCVRLLVYVSCGFDAFQRDCQRLTESGKWKLEHAEGHILFPGANAIETLAYFTRGTC